MKNRKVLVFILLCGLVLSFIIGGFPIKEVKAQGEKISLDVRDADLRDVLSALAIKTKTNIVLLEQPFKITFSVEDVSPMEALDLLLKSQGLSYIKDGKMLIVGREEKLQDAGIATSSLTRFDLIYIKGSQLEPLISTLSIPVKSFLLETSPNSIWVEGTPENLIKVKELIKAVDTFENEELVEEDKVLEFSFKEQKTYAVEPSKLVELLQQAGVPIEKYVILGNRLLVFDQDLLSNWQKFQRVAIELDRIDGRTKKIFLYRLEHLVARDAEARMAAFGFQDLELITFNFPEFSKELIVLCPPELESQIYTSLRAIDVSREKVKIPLMTATGEFAKRELHAIRQLLVEMTPVLLRDLHISENISGDPENPRHILWAEEAPDRIKMLQELLASF